MDFTNEPYVRVYKRRTVNMAVVGWEARALLREMFLVCDRSGVIDLDGVEPAEAVTALVGDMPLEVVAQALAKLLAKGTAVLANGSLVLPNFDEAQNCKKTDRARQQDSREKRRAYALRGTRSRTRSIDVPILGTVGELPAPPSEPPKLPSAQDCDSYREARGGEAQSHNVTTTTESVHSSEETSRDVTEASQPVTIGHSVLCSAVQCCADPPKPPAGADDTAPAKPRRRDWSRLLELPIAELCKALEENPHNATHVPVQERSEIREFAELWASELKRGKRLLGGYGSDSGVTAVCKLFALGYTSADLALMASAAALDAFCTGVRDRSGSKDFCVLKPALAAELFERGRRRKAHDSIEADRRARKRANERAERQQEASKRSDPKAAAAALAAVTGAFAAPAAPMVRPEPKRLTADEIARAIDSQGPGG